ncbi:MAG: transcription-repair coupling factor [Candidatus Dadabacteria bacterium]|nr:transcription-repair coupling factor [Candidatus Dadabacteria bacterium]
MRSETDIQSLNKIDYPASDGAIQSLLDHIEAGNSPIHLSGLQGTSKFYLLHRIHMAAGRPILHIVPDSDCAEEAAANIAHFFGEAPAVLRRREWLKKSPLFPTHDPETARRLHWLHSARSKTVVVAEAPALLDRTMPRSKLDESTLELCVGAAASRDELLARLAQMGYIEADFVERTGEVSRRGSIIDIFPPGLENPIRVETAGDEVYSMRHFSVADQKSIGKTAAVTVLPVSEVVLTGEAISLSLERIRLRAAEIEAPASAKLSLLEKIEAGRRVSNIEWLLPYFYEETGTVFDYLPENTLVVLDDYHAVRKSLDGAAASLPEAALTLRNRLKIPPDIPQLYLDEKWLEDKLANHPSLHIEEVEIRDHDSIRVGFHTLAPTAPRADEYTSPFDRLEEMAREWREQRYDAELVTHTDAERKKLTQILKDRGLKSLKVTTGTLTSGFVFPEAGVAIVTEKDIFGQKKKFTPAIQAVPSAFITSFSELKPGDYIVHRDVGIGIFRGLHRLEFGGKEGDFIECEYRDGDRIYVPVENLKLVQRYMGSGERRPKIDKLGQKSWERALKRVKKAVANIARELIELYARRKSEEGFRFSKNDTMFREFELSFPYEETPDQEASIADVYDDMESRMPMDRLICGDVGFGKTEVAIRAAFKAVMDGKQVAVLVPTTLLAYQHYITFSNRLRDYPVTVEMLSRFRTQSEVSEILEKLKLGSIDIVIGTHMLLGKRVGFSDLGLVVIDEEQRFGVAHKEKMRMLTRGVCALTLTATPIPRTLQISLTGIRDTSVINTPPEGRQSVEVSVHQYSKTVIKDAIARELRRGGAVFFVHNRIFDIHHFADEVRRLVPEARVEVTHGRMRESELESAISRFIRAETDVLVTTAIVESGLDIPHANTIIVNDAHTFGLADLYQLKGRVGRSSEKARALFLVPSPSSITPQARKRLRAITELKELGSGLKLALSDLEIRGAGNLFGPEQSGHIADVGVEMYLDMLDSAIKKINNTGEAVEIEPEVTTHLPCFIPDGYISEGAERLLFYKRLSGASTKRQLSVIRGEMRDRFGKIPAPAENLLQVVELKIVMKNHLIEKMEINEKDAVIIFHKKSKHFQKFAPDGRCGIDLKPGAMPSSISRKLRELINDKAPIGTQKH